MTTAFKDRRPNSCQNYMPSKQLWSNPSMDSTISVYQASILTALLGFWTQCQTAMLFKHWKIHCYCGITKARYFHHLAFKFTNR